MENLMKEIRGLILTLVLALVSAIGVLMVNPATDLVLSLLGSIDDTVNAALVSLRPGGSGRAALNRAIRKFGKYVILAAVYLIATVLVAIFVSGGLGALMLFGFAFLALIGGVAIQTAFRSLPFTGKTYEERHALGVQISRMYNIVVFAMFFIATMFMVLPEPLRNPRNIMLVLLCIFMTVSISVLMGRRRNVLLRTMGVIGTVLAIWSMTYNSIPSVKMMADARGAQLASWVGGNASRTFDRATSYYLTVGQAPFYSEAEVLQVNKGHDVANPKQLPTSSMVRANPARSQMVGGYPVPWWFVQQVTDGLVIAEGYYPSDLLKLYVAPVQRPSAVYAAARQSSVVTVSSPAISAQSSSNKPFKGLVGPEWINTGLSVENTDQVYDLVTYQGNGAGLNPSDIARIEYVHAIPGMDIELFEGNAKSPGINGGDGSAYGLSDATNENPYGARLFVRVAQGNPINLKISVNRRSK